MLRRSLMTLAVTLFGLSAWAAAPTQLGKTGVGLQIGTVNAITVKRTLDETNAWDFTIGTQSENLVGAADYLWYIPVDANVHPYFGIGAGIAWDTDADETADDEEIAGVGRLPIGVSYYPDNTQLNASFQLTPQFKTFGPSELAANVSLLYYFQ